MVEKEFEETFSQEWKQGSLYGWESIIYRINQHQLQVIQVENFCIACNKTFASESVFQHHRKGKKHIRAVNDLAKNKQNIEAT